MHWITQPAYAPPQDGRQTDAHPLVVHRRSAPTASRRLVIFVHGLCGSRYGARATWGSFPSLLFDDLPDVDIGLYRYDTAVRRLGFGRSISLEDEARVFAAILRDELDAYGQIVLIGHSMGGLLCKAAICALLETRQDHALDRIAGLILMATPQLGSLRMPGWLEAFSQDARALRPHGDFIDRVNTTFEDQIALDERIVTYRRQTIPTWSVEGANDFWVDRLSAGIGLASSRRKVVKGSHTSIVKPASRDDSAYAWVKERIGICMARFEYDVFVAAAMAAHEDDPAYQQSRDDVLSLVRTLREDCGFSSVFYAGAELPDKDAFDPKLLALQTDLAALRASRYFLLYFPEKIATSALYEAGWALILGKPSLYLVRKPDDLPFLLSNAQEAFSPPLVRILACPTSKRPTSISAPSARICSSSTHRRRAERHASRSVDLHPHLIALDAGLVGLQRLLCAHRVEQLDARREVRPVDHLTGLDVEPRPVQRTLHLAAVHDLAAGQRPEQMRARRLRREEAVFQVIDHQLLARHRERLHFADRQLVQLAHHMQCHDAHLPVD